MKIAIDIPEDLYEGIERRDGALETEYVCDELMKAVDNGTPLSSSENPNKWIPVSERLPEEYGQYICTMSNGYVQECGFVPSGEKGLIAGWSTCEADGFKKLDYQDVIAWMPLPEPYKASPTGAERSDKDEEM